MSASGKSFAAVSGLAFAVLFAYALGRPPIESLFLAQHGSAALPWVWAGVGVAAVLAVAGVGRLASRWPLPRVLVAVAAGAAVSLAGLNALQLTGVRASALLYVWKDVHVVLLLEILWAFANAVFDVKNARRAYGIFCACGSLGGMAGNQVSGALADAVGTELAILAPLPVLAVIAVAAAYVPPDVVAAAAPEPASKARTQPGARGLMALARSPYLVLLLLLVLLSQLSITLVDYAYNHVVEASYPDMDARTQVMGTVYTAIDGSALGLQLLSAPILRFVGVPATLVAIPLLLGSAVTAATLAPRFLWIAIAKVMSKAFDYSLFRAAKEILYIPLDYAQKTQGKAVIDMLVYRFAKVGASVVLGGFVVLGTSAQVLFGVLAIVALWLGVTVALTRRYRARVSREEEIRGRS